ncbi:hypothetical protein ACB092_05G020200 [Castanea dentata]
MELISELVLLELAQNRNKVPLPKSIAGPGIPLLPEQDTLIKPYQLAIPNEQSSQAVEEMDEDEDEEGGVDPNPSQEQKTDMPQHTPQRVASPSQTSQVKAL